MKRVGYVFPRGELGGAEIATVRIMEAHDRSHFEPVALLLEAGPLAERLTELDVITRIAPSRPSLSDGPGRRAARAWLAAELRSLGIAIQHSVMAWTHALAAPAARTAGTLAVWFQQNRPNPFDPVDWLASLSRTELIIANSRYVARLQRRMNPRRFPIAVVHLPVPKPEGSRRSQRIRRELGAHASTVLVVLPGRLQRWKGQDVAIRAFAQALPRAPTLRLAVVGGSLFGLERTYCEELRALVEHLRLGDRVRLVSHRTDMHAVYDSADVVLHTSRKPEPFGLVIAEGLAHGRTVIATDAGGVPEQIEHGRTGLLVRPDDPGALADILVRVARDPTLRERLGAAARGAPVQSPESAARQVEQLYHRVLMAAT